MSTGFQAPGGREGKKSQVSCCLAGCGNPLSLVTAFHLEGTFAHPAPQVVKLGTAHLAAIGHLDLGNAGRVELKNPLDSFTVGDFTDREGRIDGAAPSGDNQTRENLDPLLAALPDEGVHFHTVSHVEIRDVFLELLLFDFLDDVHGSEA